MRDRAAPVQRPSPTPQSDARVWRRRFLNLALPMATISYALLTAKTLKLDVCKQCKMEQMEIEIEVKGGLTDPSSLQIIRDAAETTFKTGRQVLEQQIAKLDAAIAAEKHPGKTRGLVNQFNAQIPAIARKLEDATKKRVAAAIAELAKGARAAEAERVAFTVGFVWSSFKLTKAALEYFTGDGDEGGDYVKIAKDIYDSLKVLIKAVGSLRAHIESESSVRAQIDATRRQIKAAKGKPVASVVDKLESQLKAYGVKIANLEKEARTVAKELDRMLKEADKGGKALTDKLAPPIDNAIQQIIAINKGIAAAKKHLKSSSDALKDAQKKAVADPRSITSLLAAIDALYDKVCGYFDKAEAQLGDFAKAAEISMDELVEALEEQ